MNQMQRVGLWRQMAAERRYQEVSEKPIGLQMVCGCVMVWAYDLVVWIYPDGEKVKSEFSGGA